VTGGSMCRRYAVYRLLFAASASAALSCCSGPRTIAQGPDHQGRANYVAAFDSELLELAGPHAIACGRSPIQSDQAAAIVCAQSSLAAGRSFRVAVQVEGVDSILWRGAARGPTGAVWLVTFDSDVHGGGADSPNARPALARTPCLRLEFSLSDPRHIFCTVPAGASEVLPLQR
jgi:hypothetical protein